MLILLWGALIPVGGMLLLSLAHLIRLRISRPYKPTTQFPVAVIVPCKGNDDPDFENNLLGIIRQDYDEDNMQFVFCVESQEDPAFPLLRRLEQRFAQVQVCVAGLATHSAQKTYNILKGMECIGETEVFVIADADIQPHSTWLQEMVAPFRNPNIGATTGFFRRVPTTPQFRWGNYFAGMFSAIIVTGLSSDQVKGLWGGSMALRKTIMDRYNLYERLATEIVDDIAIMHALHQHHIERRFVKSCTLKSYCDMSTHESIEWFIRQIQFSQIYLKWLYVFYFFASVPYAISIVLMPCVVVWGILVGNLAVVLPGIIFILLLLLGSLLLYRSTPHNRANNAPDDFSYRLLPWLFAAPVAYVLGTLALVRTRFRVERGILTMRWRNITYRVDVRTGRVLEVIR